MLLFRFQAEIIGNGVAQATRQDHFALHQETAQLYYYVPAFVPHHGSGVHYRAIHAVTALFMPSVSSGSC